MLGLAIISGIMVTIFGTAAVGITEVLLNRDPKSGPYLLAAFYLVSSAVLIGIVGLGSALLKFEILLSLNLLVFSFVFLFPMLMYIFFWRVNTYMKD